MVCPAQIVVKPHTVGFYGGNIYFYFLRCVLAEIIAVWAEAIICFCSVGAREACSGGIFKYKTRAVAGAHIFAVSYGVAYLQAYADADFTKLFGNL